MIDTNNIWHVFPTSDLKEHLLETTCPPEGLPLCNCECKPEVRIAGDGLVVIHNSFDGREAFEWDNDVRKQ